jgi:formate hydrogenlyase subunit 3/multisubunit Na+/H+ antiporter MnhD subunit
LTAITASTLTFYIFIYVINLISLIVIVKKTFSNKINLQTMPHMILYITKHSRFKNLYYGLILSLTGIPPFFLFFIKFNLLSKLFFQMTFEIFYIAFLSLFLNMIYYLQGIYLKNKQLDKTFINVKGEKFSFHEIFFINYFLAIFYCSIFFFPDLYVIFQLVC